MLIDPKVTAVPWQCADKGAWDVSTGQPQGLHKATFFADTEQVEDSVGPS